MCSNNKSDLMFLEKKPQWFCKRKNQSGHHVPKILFACDFRFANSHKQMKNDNSLLFTSLPSGYIVNSRCHITTKITHHFGTKIQEITQYSSFNNLPPHSKLTDDKNLIPKLAPNLWRKNHDLYQSPKTSLIFCYSMRTVHVVF